MLVFRLYGCGTAWELHPLPFPLSGTFTIYNTLCIISIAREQADIYNEHMSTPEIIPEQPRQPDVEPRVEGLVIPETEQQLGVSAPPQAPQAVVSDNNQIIATPVQTAVQIDPVTTITVPANLATNEKELEKGAHGPSNLAITWLDMYWLREVSKALSKGLRVIFGQK